VTAPADLDENGHVVLSCKSRLITFSNAGL
jgi:hypothetical protein